MTKYRFEDIAYNSTEKKKPVEEDKYTYIGLEHLDPQCFEVTRYGSEVAPIGEKLVMKKGDVLFGKRRAYQKKVAIAPFDGIFSAHGMVLRPKEKVIDPKFFPMFIASDYFLDSAIKISVGSLSPTINWSALKELEFELPDLNKQRELAELLWAAEKTKQTYKRLIDNSHKLIQAEFIDIFKCIPTCKLCELTSIKMGQSPDSKTYNKDEKGLPFYQGKTGFGNKYIQAPVLWCSAPTRIAEGGDVLLSVRAPVGDVNISTEKCCIGRGLAAIHPIENISDTLFLFYALSALKSEIENSGVGSTFKAITKEQVHSILIPKANINLQHKFVEFATMQEKTLEALNKTKSYIEITAKSLINQNLTKEVSHV